MAVERGEPSGLRVSNKTWYKTYKVTLREDMLPVGEKSKIR